MGGVVPLCFLVLLLLVFYQVVALVTCGFWFVFYAVSSTPVLRLRRALRAHEAGFACPQLRLKIPNVYFSRVGDPSGREQDKVDDFEDMDGKQCLEKVAVTFLRFCRS